MIADPVVAAYAAGLIDGEGYIGVSVARAGGPRKTDSFRIVVKIAMCERGAIEFVARHYGGSRIALRPRKNPRHRPTWEWTIRGMDAARLLSAAEPYMHVKQRQARLAIEICERVKSVRYMPSTGGRRIAETPPEEVAVRRALSTEIKRLNARGVSMETPQGFSN